MNIEKMKAFAQAQRESEESTEIRPAPKPAEPEYQPEAIYIPIEDDDPTEIPDDGFAAVSNEEEPELPETESIEDIITKCFPEDKSYNIELDRLLPLRSPIFTDGGDLSELSSSIARMGITEPLLVRSAGNGEYEILSGNRRRDCRGTAFMGESSLPDRRRKAHYGRIRQADSRGNQPPALPGTHSLGADTGVGGAGRTC